MIDRGAIEPPSTPGMDSGPEIRADAFVPPGEDTGTSIDDPDAYAPPEIDAYVVPDPDAGPGSGPCDERGEGCCGTTCRGGLECSGSSLCDLPGCGAAGAACCVMDRCFGTSACNGATCEPCGGTGQLCCSGTPACADGAATCDGSRCVACGDLGQPCCGGTCRAGACTGGQCRPPEGSIGGPCRGVLAMPRCDGQAYCNDSGNCESCGHRGETCCPIGRCSEGSCSWGNRCE